MGATGDDQMPRGYCCIVNMFGLYPVQQYVDQPATERCHHANTFRVQTSTIRNTDTNPQATTRGLHHPHSSTRLLKRNLQQQSSTMVRKQPTGAYSPPSNVSTHLSPFEKHTKRPLFLPEVELLLFSAKLSLFRQFKCKQRKATASAQRLERNCELRRQPPAPTGIVGRGGRYVVVFGSIGLVAKNPSSIETRK